MLFMTTEVVIKAERPVKKAINTFPVGTIVSMITESGRISTLLIVKSACSSCVWAYDLDEKELKDFVGELKATELDARIEVFGETMEEE
ncbi:hypothetical protein F0C79_23995 [Escherichia coli]|nr:hypothetical protein [Escherichia coli]